MIATREEEVEKVVKAIVSYSEIVKKQYTIFRVSDKLPRGARFVMLDGERHELFPVYGTNPMMLAIRGEHDLTDKEITFITKDQSFK